MKLLVTIAATILIAQTVFAQQELWITKDTKEEANFFEQNLAFREYWTARGVETDKLPKGKGYKAFERYAWFMSTRVDQNGRLNSEKLWKGWEEKKRNFSHANSREATSNWTNLGPQTSIPSNGGGAGRINCITFDPTNSNIIWVGTPSGGIWKTTDGGTSWTTNTDELPNSIGVSSIAIDPTNTNIMYAGTGDRDAGDTYATGVLKSTNGGINWFQTGLSWTVNQGVRVSKLIIHPTSTNTIIAATSAGIYKTTNGGTSWTNVASGDYKDLEKHPTDNTIWYAARYSTTASNVGVYKSTNSGDSWYKVTSGLPTTGILRCELAVSPHTPNAVYVIYCKNGTKTVDDYEFYGLYRSTDSGTNFTARYTGTKNLLGWETTGNDNGGQGWYDLTLAVSPTDYNVVFVGGVNIWKSVDGGTNWSCVGVWNGSGSSYVHADHHALEFLPGSGTTLFSGNDGGLFKSTNTGAGWFDLSNGLGIHQFYRIGVSQTNANIVYGGAQDNGTDRYSSGSWTRVIGGDGMECAVDYTNANIAYGSLYYGNLYRTTNGGSFSDMTDPTDDGDWVTPYVLHPTTSTTLYYATSRVYRCTNASGTPSWTPISPNLVGLYYKLTSLAVAPSDVNYIYTANKDSFFRTTNGGTSWQVMTGIPANVKYIAVHPTNPSQVYAVIGGYTAGSKVYVSTNAGANWTNISGTLPNIPVNCITLNSDYPDHIYVGTDLGVFLSEDAGANWSAFDTGLPNVIVNELEIQKSSGKIRAATYGRGLWESPIAPIPAPNTITVTAPNGGENLTGGATTNITWTSTGTIANVKLEYSLDGGSTWTTITASTVNDGSEAWTVPSSATTQGRVRVSDASNSATNDMSNANFTIAVITNSITVTAPNGGETWTQGTSQNITWTSTGTIANVKIEYSINSGSTWTTVIASTGNTGSYAWTVPNNPATTCRVRVSDAANSATNDMSNANFTIASGGGYITAETEPNDASTAANGPVGSATAVSGSIHTSGNVDWFTFTTGSVGTISVSLAIGSSADLDWYLYDAGLVEKAKGYTNANPETGSYANAPAGTYYIKVAGYLSATSAYTLTVTYPGTVTNSVTVTAPNGGENWTVGSSRNITWTHTGSITNVKIEYSTNSGTNWIVITNSIANNGSYAWTIPNTASTSCRVRVSDAASSATNDISNANFTISSGGTTVTLLSEGFETNSVPGTYWLAADQNSSNGSDYWGDKSSSSGSRVKSGSWSAFCAKNGMTTAAYDNYMNSYMEYKNGLNISGYSNVKITFWIWYKTYNSYDYCSFQYWNGSGWVEFSGGRWYGTGSGSQTWSQKTFDVPAAAGTTFKFRWVFYSNSSSTSEGVYIDDIVVTGVSNNIKPMAKTTIELPTEFGLSQNFPNPFNPTTTIKFDLPRESSVTLNIYNTNGQLVRTLVNGHFTAGYHKAVWDGRNEAGQMVSSGLYIYRIQAGNYVKSMKMMLMK